MKPPLLVQRGLYLDEALPDLAFVFLANPTAGILEGDQQTIEVNVGPGCKAHVCTQAATKIFSMPSGCARQRVSLTLQERAYLEYLPDAMIPFRDASFSQETVITVAPGAILVFGEIMSPGRVEMGESFAFSRWRSQLTVIAPDGTPLYREAYTLAPSKQNPLGVGVMGRFTAPSIGTLLLINDSLDLEKLRDGIRDRVEKLPEPASSTNWGVSLLPHDIGVGLKVVGESTSAVAKVMRAAWAEGRRQLLGTDLPPLRKY